MMLDTTRRQRPWSSLLALLLLALPGAALADDDWPRGHYPLPEHGSLVGAPYTVAASHEQTLLDIAREHAVGYEEIRNANPEVSLWLPGEGTEVVIPAQHLLPDAPREGIVINIAELRLYYYPEVGDGETPRVETYPIGIGREGFDTPLGTTRTTMKLEDPAWYPPESVRQEAAARGEEAPAVVPPGPDNPLGRHAILLEIPGYLIHGTNRPDGIGMRASRGCIRMFPEDVEALFRSVPVDTPVNLIDQPFKAAWQDGTLYAQSFATPEVEERALSHRLEALATLEALKAEAQVAIDYAVLSEALDAAPGRIVGLSPGA
ncbi:L,D-transpeptidase family protein [Halomonas pacifica]|uniref:L,D-transpeptidase family protein n=1 Tax=Bisbaumannia pacifica TaxID=77098 RepID=UPI002358B96C|nr:L,D-transpeptidase family protein [Halomonas pacifica]MDC8802873.1 L,D-transpeptidase family protein [Halomonas pacifica]